MIYEKLQKARVELQNKQLKKTGKNKFSGFTYYELSDILPTINKIFLDLKLCSNFSILEGCATLAITDWEDNSSVEFTSPIETLELKGCTKIQALGGVHTYLKRYLYLNALEIVEADMLDAQAGNIEENTTKKTSKPAPKEAEDTEIQTNQPEIDKYAEIDIYEGLKETIDANSAFTYFKNNINNVTDKTKFRMEYQKHYNKLKENK